MMYNRSRPPEGVCPNCFGTGMLQPPREGFWPCNRCDGTGVIGYTGYTIIAVIASVLACVAIAALVLH